MKTLSLILAVSLLSTPRAQAVPYLLGGLVIIVGAGLGVVGCRVVKKCKKIFGRSATNAPPEELGFAPASDEYGAAFWWPEEGYCAAERGLPQVPVCFTLNVLVNSVSNCTVTVRADVGVESTENFDEFKESLAGSGLSWPESPRFMASFERNRQPVVEEQVPIKMNFETRTATVGRGGVLVIVESSSDLAEWTLLTRIEVEPGAVLSLQDVSSEKQFFRVKTSTP